MKKKKSSGGGANWMDTYGDMVTLLLCFFVLLYSMSTISEEKWRAIVTSFNPNAILDPTENSGNDGPIADEVENPGTETLVNPRQDDIDAAIEQLYQALQSYAQQNNMSETLSVTKGDGKVYVTFNQTAFFNGNSSELRSDALPILEAVSGMLNEVRGAIDEVQILGHTAQESTNVPNYAPKDRRLASERATNVLIYVQQHSEIDPGRLVSMGLGQWHPVGDNATAEGRAQNRRVEMIVSGRNIEQELADGILVLTTEPEETGGNSEATTEPGT